MFSRRSDTAAEVVLTPHRIVGNLLYGSDGTVTAWYVLPTVRWAFLTPRAREMMAMAFTARLTLLAGYHIHIRVTTMPFAAADWARNLEAITAPSLGIERFPAGHPFKRWLVAQQQRVITATTDEKMVYIGVQLRAKRTLTSKVGEKVGLGSGLNETVLRKEAAKLGEYIAGEGFEGRPATQADVEWLLRRSVGLGMPAPRRVSPVGEEEPWEPEDMGEITDGVYLDATPFAPFVKVIRTEATGRMRSPAEVAAELERTEAALAEAISAEDAVAERRARDYITALREHKVEPTERYVAVLTLGRSPRVNVSPVPWMTITDRFAWPIEWSVRLDVLEGSEARRAIGHALLKVRDMQKHYADHDITEPLKLARQIEQARAIDDQTTSGDPLLATRAHGWFDIAVSADTEEKALYRAGQIIDAFRTYNMTLVHPYGATSGGQQHAHVQSFVPSMPLASKARVRRFPALYVGIGMPTVSSSLGDNRGAYIGYTTGHGGRRAVFFDTHYSTEVRHKEGLWAVVGSLGAGKSSVAGSAFIYPSVQRGIPTFVWDPSGPMKQLCKLPEFEGRTRHIDLGDQAPGTLSPFGVVSEPRRQDYESEELFVRAKADAAALRRQLAIDTIMGLLPKEYAHDGPATLAIRRAVKLTKGLQTASLRTVIEYLQGMHGVGDEKFGTLGKELAEYLDDVGDMPIAKLLFPPMGGDAPRIGGDDKILTVITMQGVQLPPPGVDRFSLDPSMQIVLPVLQLATWLTVRGIYSGPMKRRKTVVLDESHWLADWPAGRALFNRLAYDNRKWNTCVATLSQLPGGILGLGNAASLLAGAFVGRIEDEDEAKQALRLLRVHEESGYDAAITRLGVGPNKERQFIFRDANGRVDQLNVDISHLPGLLEALNTNADQPTAPPALSLLDDDMQVEEAVA